MASRRPNRNHDAANYAAFLGGLSAAAEGYLDNERALRRAQWIQGEARLLELVAASLMDTILEPRTGFQRNNEFLKAMRTVAATGVQQLQSIVRSSSDDLQISREPHEPEETYDEREDASRRNIAQEIEWMWQDTWQENDASTNPADEQHPERGRLFAPARQELECLIKVSKLVLRRHQAEAIERPPRYNSPAVRRDPITGELPPNYHSRSNTPVQHLERDMTRAFRDAGERGEGEVYRPLSPFVQDQSTSPSSSREATGQETQFRQQRRRRSSLTNLVAMLRSRHSLQEDEVEPSSSRPQSSSTIRPPAPSQTQSAGLSTGGPSSSNTPPAGQTSSEQRQSGSSGRGAGQSGQPLAGSSGQGRSGRDRHGGQR